MNIGVGSPEGLACRDQLDCLLMLGGQACS